MHLVKTLETSLEIVDYPNNPALTTDELFGIVSVGDTVIRPIEFSSASLRDATGDYDLKFDDILKHGDEFLDMMAAAIGGTVIQHDWKLLRTNPRHNPKVSINGYSRQASEIGMILGLPETRLWLGAAVPRISGVSLCTNSKGTPHKPEHRPLLTKADTALQIAAEQYFRKSGWKLSDIECSRQFMTAQGIQALDAAVTPNEVEPYLVDIDLLFVN